MVKVLKPILLATAAIFILPTVSYAQEYSLEILPSIIVFDKANLKSQALTIKNASSEAVELTPQFYNITDTKALDGSISIGSKNQTLSGAIKLSENNTPISTLKLEPLESRQISLNYQTNQTNATEFFTILWEPKMAKNEAGIDESITYINPSIGTVILATNTASEPNLPKVSWHAAKFQKSGPLTFDITFENASKDLMIVTPRVRINNILDQTVSTIEFPTQYLLPESKRSLKFEGKIPAWNDKVVLGRYTSTLEVIDAKNQTHLLQETKTYVLPILPIAISSLIIFFILGVYLRVRRNSRTN